MRLSRYMRIVLIGDKPVRWKKFFEQRQKRSADICEENKLGYTMLCLNEATTCSRLGLACFRSLGGLQDICDQNPRLVKHSGEIWYQCGRISCYNGGKRSFTTNAKRSSRIK